MIYGIINSVENKPNFICPDQATIDQGQAYGYQGIYSIGTKQDAQAIQINNQQAWLANNLSLFSVNKDIDVTEGTQWTACNLDQEPDNTDVCYQVFEVVSGIYQEAVGLANAKTLLNQTKQNAQNLSIALNSFESWHPLPRPQAGLQTL